MPKVFPLAAIAIAIAFVPANALAVTITYDLEDIDIDVNTGFPGLVIETLPNPAPIMFDLDDGESIMFPLFRIWTNESILNVNDFIAQDATVTLNFAGLVPSGTVEGETDGFFLPIVNNAGGLVTWDDPVIVSSPLVTYQIELSNASFNVGSPTPNPGFENGSNVKATITQITSVPEPSTFAIAGVGLGVVGVLGLRRRRRLAAAA